MGELTLALQSFIAAFSKGYANLFPSVRWLFGTLLAIELVLFGLWWAFGQGDIKDAIRKIFYVGIWLWIVSTFPALASQVMLSFTQAGTVAGGGAPVNILDPSSIMSQGLVVAQPVLQKISTFGTFDIGNMIVYGLLALLLLLAFAIIAIQIFVTVLEFYLVTALVGILLPFALNRYTQFLAERAIGAVISFGIKLMVLTFIIAVATPIIDAVVMPTDPDTKHIIATLVVVGAIAFLAWNAPGIAAGLLSGSPSLSAGTALQNTVAGAALGGIALAGGAAAAYGATRAAASVVSGGASLLASAAGAAQEGIAALPTPASGASIAERLGTATGGALRGMGRALTESVRGGVSERVGAAMQGIRGAYNRGQRAAQGVSSTASAATGGGATGASDAPSWARRAAQNMGAVSRAVPQEARPEHGGATPTLPRE